MSESGVQSAKGTERTYRSAYRGPRWRQLVKPVAVKVISYLSTSLIKLRMGDRVTFGRNFRANHKLVIKGPGRVILGDNINAWAHAEKTVLLTFSPEAVITVGDGCRLSGASLQAYKGISVGPECIIGSAIVVDTDFHNVDPALRHALDAPIPCAPIILERNVWVAGQAVVLKGVRVGENSVVAYRAVVTKDVPPNVVVGGNPARVVREL